MSNKKKKYEEAEALEAETQQKSTTKVYFYIGLGATVLSAVALGLMFVEVLGIYALICSVLLSIGALSFFNTQKKKNNLSYLKYFVIAAYVVLGLSAVVFVAGTIYSAVTPSEGAEILSQIK